MAKIRIKNVGSQIYVVQDERTVYIYNKSTIQIYAVEGVIYIDSSGKNILIEETSNFVEPLEKSTYDLLVLLNNMLLISGSQPEKVISGAYTLKNSDSGYVLIVDATVGNFTITMPPDAQPGLLFQFKDNGNALATTNEVVIDGGGRNVDGLPTAPDITVAYEARLLYLSESQSQYLML